ncbi:MAG: hypothetical protein ACREX3_08795, partial [Gammaproteobacteria bacterium]
IGLNGWRTSEPVFIPSERPRGVRKMAELLYGNPINVKKFAEDLCVTPQLLKVMLDLYGSGNEGLSPTRPFRTASPPRSGGLLGNVHPFPRR